MAIWVYRCQSCGGTHDVSVRPAGAMLLRCTTLHEWAWHDESAFVSAAAPIGRDGAGVKRLAAKAGGTKARSAKARGRTRAAARSRRGSKKRTGAPRRRVSRGTARRARVSSGRTKRRR